jgi:hypothetical protein
MSQKEEKKGTGEKGREGEGEERRGKEKRGQERRGEEKRGEERRGEKRKGKRRKQAGDQTGEEQGSPVGNVKELLPQIHSNTTISLDLQDSTIYR